MTCMDFAFAGGIIGGIGNRKVQIATWMTQRRAVTGFQDD
jgi:hypothetical protein